MLTKVYWICRVKTVNAIRLKAIYWCKSSWNCSIIDVFPYQKFCWIEKLILVEPLTGAVFWGMEDKDNLVFLQNTWSILNTCMGYSEREGTCLAWKINSTDSTINVEEWIKPWYCHSITAIRLGYASDHLEFCSP